MKKTTEKKKYTRYTRQHLFRRNLRFWLCWLALIALIAVGFIRVHAYFDENLQKFESVQYPYLAESVGEMFTSRDFGKLWDYEDTDNTEFLEDKEDYIAYLNQLTEGKTISVKQVSSTVASEVRYQVTADNAAFAEFTLRKSGESFTFEVIPLLGYTVGSEVYELGDIKTDVIQPVTYDYTIPESAVITVNGNPLPESTIVKQGEALFYEGHLPEGFPSDTLTSYRFTCALGTPEITVTDKDGNELELKEVGQDSYRYEFAYCDDEMKSRFEEYGVDFVKLLCRYTTDNCKMSTLNAKVQSGSAAAATIQAIPTQWRTKADSYTFNNISTCNYARYSDTLYSCEVHLTYHGSFKGKINDYETSCLVFFTKVKGDWLVYDFLYL